MNTAQILKEIHVKAVRSSGSGGQHVNKVATKIVLEFNLEQSLAFSDSEKALLLDRLSTRITKEGLLIVHCGQTRSQHRNKALAIERLLALLSSKLKVQKKRKQTKVPKSVNLKRLEQKRQHAQKKASRKKPRID